VSFNLDHSVKMAYKCISYRPSQDYGCQHLFSDPSDTSELLPAMACIHRNTFSTTVFESLTACIQM